MPKNIFLEIKFIQSSDSFIGVTASKHLSPQSFSKVGSHEAAYNVINFKIEVQNQGPEA
jgi:hypothetical protein